MNIGGASPLLGDVLVSEGTVFYAISNIWEVNFVVSSKLITNMTD